MGKELLLVGAHKYLESLVFRVQGLERDRKRIVVSAQWQKPEMSGFRVQGLERDGKRIVCYQWVLTNTWKVWFLGFRVWRERKRIVVSAQWQKPEMSGFWVQGLERDGKRIVISGCSQILGTSGIQGLGFGARQRKNLFVGGGKNLKSRSLGFRVWREIEKELLVGGDKYLKSQGLWFRDKKRERKKIVSRW